MPNMDDTLKQIWVDADAARTKAAQAYDSLVAELDPGPPAADDVVALSGQIWLNSIKFAAELWLAPTRVADAIKDPTKP